MGGARPRTQQSWQIFSHANAPVGSLALAILPPLALSTRDDIANGARVRHIDQPIGRDSVGRFGDQHSLALDQVPDSRDCCPFPNATELRQKSGHFWNTLRWVRAIAHSLRRCGHDYSNRCSHPNEADNRYRLRPTLLSPPVSSDFCQKVKIKGGLMFEVTRDVSTINFAKIPASRRYDNFYGVTSRILG